MNSQDCRRGRPKIRRLMRKLFTSIIVLAACAKAFAEVKIINGTGRDLVLDLLSQKGSVTGVKLPALANPNFTIGDPKTPFPQEAMLVVRSAEGEEKYRERVENGRIYVIGHWNPYIYSYVGDFKGAKPGDSYPHVLNGTGVPFKVKVTNKDMSVSEDALEGPSDKTTVPNSSFGQAQYPGDDLQLEFTPGDGGPTTSTKLKCGIVYWMQRGPDGKVQFAKIGTK